MKNSIIINKNDNVIVAIKPIDAGTIATYEVCGEQLSVVATEDIQIFHKLARVNIKAGEQIIKYGEYIGEAATDIPAGSHVHNHNILSIRKRIAD